jgi:SAM-dependent methyltransferase
LNSSCAKFARNSSFNERIHVSSPTKKTHTMDWKSHWTKIYEGKVETELGWYEAYPKDTIHLINSLNLSKYAEIFLAGAGATTLIDYLLEDGFQNININDVSPIALSLLRENLGKEECNVEWILDDLTKPTALNDLPQLDLWIDRAVFHFFTDPQDRDTYFNLLKSKVKVGGYVLLAAFAKGGAEKCAGLPIVQYDLEMFEEILGPGFETIATNNSIFVNPKGGQRPYIYGLFQRN